MNYKQRVLEELIELHEKRVLLENYIINKEVENILKDQLNVMREYESILMQRIFDYLNDEVSEVK